MNIHPSITLERVLDALERHRTVLDDPGFCAACGVDVDGIEQDAHGYQCDACGSHAVHGAGELLIMMTTS